MDENLHVRVFIWTHLRVCVCVCQNGTVLEPSSVFLKKPNRNAQLPTNIQDGC